jgi:HEAT repeat protein
MSQSVYHTDFWSKDDYLNFADYRPVLAQILLEANTPLTVGLFGSWGTGKTTLLKMLQHDVEEKGPGSVRTIWFTAWKYDRFDALWRAFILRVLDQLYPRADSKDPWEKRERLNRAAIVDPGQRKLVDLLQKMEESVYRDVEWQEFSKVSIDAMQLAANIGKGAAEVASAFLPVPGVIKPLAKLIGLDESLTDEMEKSASVIKHEFNKHRREQLNSLEQFENLFKEALDLALGRDGRLIVFVDDLDRCLPEKAIEILETIKLFLEAEKTVFVIGMDQEIVERGIEIRYREYLFNQNREGASIPLRGNVYLQKIIHIPFYLPPMNEEDISNFIDHLEGRAKKGASLQIPFLLSRFDSERVIDTLTRQIFSTVLPPNPRQIKRAMNIFKLLQGIALVREENKSLPRNSVSWPLLAKTVLIQTQFPELYQHWKQEPRLVTWLEEAFIHYQQERVFPKEKDKIKESHLAPYVQTTDMDFLRKLERLFVHQQSEDRPRGDRFRTRFGDLSPEELTVYLRLAGSIAIESVTARALGEKFEELKSGEKPRVRAAVEHLLQESTRDAQDKATWMLERFQSADPRHHVAWAEALARLNRVERAIAILQALVSSDEREILLQVIDTVKAVGDVKFLDVLIRCYRERDDEIAKEMESALISTGATATPAGLQIIKDPSAPARFIFLRASLKTQDLDPYETLINLINENDIALTEQILIELGNLREKRAKDLILQYVQQNEPLLRAAAVFALGKLGQEDTVPLIEGLRGDDPSPVVRAAAANALIDMGALGVPVLIELLFGQEETTREAAKIGLIKIGVEAIEPLTAYITNHNVTRKRLEVLTELYKSIGDPGLPPLLNLLHKPDTPAKMRVQILEILHSIDTEKSMQALVSCLALEDTKFRAALSNVLVTLEDGIFPYLISYLESHPDDDATEIIVDVFVQRAPDSLPYVRKKVTNTRPHIRKVMLQILGQASDSEAFPLIVDRLDDNSPTVRQEAIRALGGHPTPDAIQYLMKVIRSKDGPSVDVALEVLRSLKPIHLETISSLRPIIDMVATPDEDRKKLCLDILLSVNEKRVVEELDSYTNIKMTGPLLKAAFAILANYRSEQAVTLFLTLANSKWLEEEIKEAVQQMSDWLPERIFELLPEHDFEDVFAQLLVLSGKPAIPHLKRYIQSSGTSVEKKKAMKVLRDIGEEESAKALGEILGDLAGNLRIFNLDLLGKMKFSQVQAYIFPLLREGSPDVQKKALTTLQLIGDQEAITALEELCRIKQVSRDLKDLARQAIQTIETRTSEGKRTKKTAVTVPPS